MPPEPLGSLRPASWKKVWAANLPGIQGQAGHPLFPVPGKKDLHSSPVSWIIEGEAGAAPGYRKGLIALGLERVPAKTIVSGYSPGSQWFGINYNMNIYRGCCHGCIYCDSRSACYGVEDFDRVRIKDDALRIIRDDLRRKVKPGIVGTGAMSDPYNPFEEELLLTRHALELLAAYGFGASVTTKSPLITRDIDLFREIGEQSPILCMVTVTTPDDRLAALIEPHAPPPSQRLQAVKELSQAGVFAGVLLNPVLPFLTDSEENLLAMVQAVKETGARFLYSSLGMTLRMNQRDHYYQKLEERFPGLADRYRRTYGDRYWCAIPSEKKRWGLFARECDRLGLLYRMEDIIAASRAGYGSQQLSFFQE